jgi:hypothetical protein
MTQRGNACQNNQKEYEQLFVLLFTRLALQGIVCYTFIFRVVIGEVFADYTDFAALVRQTCLKFTPTGVN